LRLLQTIKEVVKSLKHKKISEKPQKYCPRCGSKNLKEETRWLILPIPYYKCEDCGYEGPIFMEKEEKS